MKLIMAGIDYKTAAVDVRGRFALAPESAARARTELRRSLGDCGCVLISTCNRTELYLSYRGDVPPDPAAILCGALGFDAGEYRGCFRLRGDRAAVMHLMMLAAGLRSQVRGEDQVLAQVKQAITAAREDKICDATLETLFRLAITAAKRVKTLVPLYAVERSTAGLAADALEAALGGLEGKTALVIGNGETGRLAAVLLMRRGCGVTMTRRSYRRGEAVIPEGCGEVAYEERYAAMSGCDILLSATASPHFTVRAEEFLRCVDYPRYVVDIAVPRDIDPAIGRIDGISCWSVDSFGDNGIQYESADKLIAIRGILDEHARKFEKWNISRKIYVNCRT